MKHLCKVVERYYFKNPSASKYCLMKDYPRGIYPKRTLIFDADGLLYREYYYNTRCRSVGIVYHQSEYPGWQFVEETEQKNETGQTIHHKKEYRDTHSGRMFEEHFYEYQDGTMEKECRITRFEEIVGLTIFKEELFYNTKGSVQYKKSFRGHSDKEELELVDELRYEHGYNENNDVIRTDIFRNDILLLRICQKYYYDEI